MPNENYCILTTSPQASELQTGSVIHRRCRGARIPAAWLVPLLLLLAPLCLVAGQPALGERLQGYYAREGNDGSPAATAGNNIYLKFFEDRWIGLLFVPYPYAIGMQPQRIERAFEIARSRTENAAYLRDRFGQFDEPATAQIERYGYLEDRIAFECGALSACTLRLNKGFLELIKPGIINEHIVRYHYVEVN